MSFCGDFGGVCVDGRPCQTRGNGLCHSHRHFAGLSDSELETVSAPIVLQLFFYFNTISLIVSTVIKKQGSHDFSTESTQP